jgi:UDP-N-acetylmuramoyl-tripeptide--D-alanyl-D-alanine ligase
MKRISLEYAAAAAGGTIYRDSGEYKEIQSVSIDSRTIPADCLFFCIIGERVDAHQFLPDVREKGCHNVVVSDEGWAKQMAECGDVNVILVKDTRRALMAMGEKYLDDWKGLRKVGVTGSVGKTSTKEFLYSVLRSKYRTGKTPGNLNSEFGIPLTAFSFPTDIEVAVIEMGAGYGSAIGELAQIAKPEAAVVTCVGTSHLEVYGTREALLDEKLRVATGFTPDNTLVINTDSDILTLKNARAHQPGNARIVTVGSRGGEDYHISEMEDCGIQGVQCKVTHHGETAMLRLPVIGAHNLGNAVLAIAIGEVFGIGLADAVKALSEVEMNANRLDVIEANGITVINDTYNASPESMKAGLDVLSHSPASRRIAVLGSMFELGDNSEALHRSVGEYARSTNVDMLISVGENGKAIAEGAKDGCKDSADAAENMGAAGKAANTGCANAIGMSDGNEAAGTMSCGCGAMKIFSYSTREEAAEALKPMLREGDVVYVKASRSMALEKLVQAITE